jgi:hypothetical protein
MVGHHPTNSVPVPRHTTTQHHRRQPKELIVMYNDSTKDELKTFRAAGHTNKPKSRLNPGAQRVILENAVVNRIRGEIDYANAFLLRSFRLSLEMEAA